MCCGSYECAAEKVAHCVAVEMPLELAETAVCDCFACKAPAICPYLMALPPQRYRLFWRAMALPFTVLCNPVCSCVFFRGVFLPCYGYFMQAPTAAEERRDAALGGEVIRAMCVGAGDRSYLLRGGNIRMLRNVLGGVEDGAVDISMTGQPRAAVPSKVLLQQ